MVYHGEVSQDEPDGLQTLVKPEEFRDSPWRELDALNDLQTAFLVVDIVLAAIGATALIIAGLGIINTLLMAVLERTREIGIYKALGASDGDVRLLFLGEAALVGVFGGVGGLLLGRVVSWLIQMGANAFAESRGITAEIDLFRFPLWLLGGAVLFSMLMSILSGVYPASRAARIEPIRALRSE